MMITIIYPHTTSTSSPGCNKLQYSIISEYSGALYSINITNIVATNTIIPSVNPDLTIFIILKPDFHIDNSGSGENTTIR